MNHDRADMEKLEAAAFRRLVEHLRLRQDISNIELMGRAGFCRNCLADWLAEASIATPVPLTREEARHLVYGEPYSHFKARHLEATPEQLEQMARSKVENDRVRHIHRNRQLDTELEQSFPASDPPSMTDPH